jgi:hypothetical protein
MTTGREVGGRRLSDKEERGQEKERDEDRQMTSGYHRK